MGADEIPDRLLRDLADTPYVPEWALDAYLESHGSVDLSDAELAVLKCVSRGLQVKEAAVVVGKDFETVKTQLKSARYKLRAKTSGHAACEAIRRGLIP